MFEDSVVYALVIELGVYRLVYYFLLYLFDRYVSIRITRRFSVNHFKGTLKNKFQTDVPIYFSCERLLNFHQTRSSFFTYDFNIR